MKRTAIAVLTASVLVGSTITATAAPEPLLSSDKNKEASSVFIPQDLVPDHGQGSSVTDPLGTQFNGPEKGAPLGGSSVVQPDGGFFANDQDLTGKAPGEIIGSRELNYSLAGLPTPLRVVQLKFVTTDGLGRPAMGITSVVKPPRNSINKVLSFHSVYDSLNPEHSPSRAIQGNLQLGTMASMTETAVLLPFLEQGYTVVVTDIEGQQANLGAGPVYGTNTLDGLRATLASPLTGVSADAPIGLLGYSGGAIATNWAAQLAPSYAPDINDNLVGAASGGLLVNPITNIAYLDGAGNWSPLLAMTIVGLSREYGINPEPYLSDYGMEVYRRLEHATILEVYALHRHMTWGSLFKPEYQDPRSIPELVEVLNKVNLGLAPDPTVPFFYGQANAGYLDGTATGGPGVGHGDGVMVTGDTRTLARKACAAGVPVDYREYDNVSHTMAFVAWYPAATAWMLGRFNGQPAPNTCASIPEGNDLSAIKPL